MRRRVAVAMSGGVDSSLAAALLLRQGFAVIGLTMATGHADAGEMCSLAAVQDARRVASFLGIEHHVVDVSQRFAAAVVRHFCEGYRRGVTPNPCVVCNREVKFGALLEEARRLGADCLASGHYARVERREDGRHLLMRAKDRRKDQSYALFSLRQEQLRHALFPLGGQTKEETRRLAREMGLCVAGRPESQELCFAGGDYGRLLRRLSPDGLSPGDILDSSGRVIGRHRGIAFYTVGQRRGLGLVSPIPLYVLAIRPEQNVIVVGPEEALYGKELAAGEVNFIPFDVLEGEIQVTAKVRYAAAEARAVVCSLGSGQVRVSFAVPQRAITPGQAVVFYDGEIVVGGGTIMWRLDEP